MTNRRDFIKYLLGSATAYGLSTSLASCHDGAAHIRVHMPGADHATGHLLRTPGKLPAPTSQKDVDVLIAGGGITGLSAMRWLQKNGVQGVHLLEMADSTGGNSLHGRNEASAYPWGAHYLPVPDVANTELLDFLQSIGTVTGYHQGLPVYNEYHICHDPEERLLIDGHWQEGIVPSYGIGPADSQQIADFFSHVNELKDTKGVDGKYLFAIPIDHSSADSSTRRLDDISFADYLAAAGYHAPSLLWYLQYCCKDDYGASLSQASAWAGLHYFAARRGNGANANAATVLTWPQGNGFLAEGLRRQCLSGSISTGMLVYGVQLQDGKAHVSCYHPQSGNSVLIRAGKLLLATPQYVNKHILPGSLRPVGDLYAQVQYAPWVIANITTRRVPQGRGAPLSWDNVIYGRDSVGYVYANHQDLATPAQGVLTYYLPVVRNDPAEARRFVYNKDKDYWKKYILDELEFAHPGITAHVSRMDIWVWGHGMIMPTPGYIWGGLRQQGMAPVDNTLFFAHSDLSGISIFEEAFYQGIRAAKEIMKH